MDTSRALEEFGESLRRRFRDQELRERLAALAVLREYFVEYAEIRAVESLGPSDLIDFALRWLLRADEVNLDAANLVLATLGEWVRSLPSERSGTSAEMVRLIERLERDVARTLTALAAMRDVFGSEKLTAALDLADESGAGMEGSLTTGLDRLVRPGEVDYETADQDEFVIRAIDGPELSLQRLVPLPGLPEELSPVRVPSNAAGQLLPGDILNIEVGRGAGGWEILEVTAVIPGGYTKES